MLQKHNLFHLFIWIYRNCKLVNVLGKTKVQLSEIHVLKGEKILQRPDTGLRDTSGPSSLSRNGHSVREAVKKPVLRKGTERNMPDYTRTGLKFSQWWIQIWKFGVFVKGSREAHTISVNNHLQNKVEALSRFACRQVVLDIVENDRTMNTEMATA